ncbi:LysR family transcriptional regulator [Pseudomonas sp. FW306-02-F02-AA]|jgi:DNA-binding transcriptional LysR family regulator|uniref:LysR family transcriptional regulator n=1 Tax=Pseudomonas fluorescens TaxID=294 RepID=A0A0N9WJ23_PSEFL|nr:MULTISPECIES: LysR family transcriptional regulator [Pseudomonas]ALI01617.1 LysR family transcriptional regulator [Pseudomonas fluorescens]PMZ00812.1 LysR family transcriptional regulator [Pseudomonas sp. FW306-02-F02-AB]PMZ06665.1 LysR family transcriptional regulator [Pseudomonas sp. FW306-02-H06C]PMZ12504.1 LysR family transcriptional regulator [Pseudomonas sp. FW306-02-F02-AA]PMZ18474.1 LysR family transcriptional regulator [Pseudomonas sp. FW306-02-F08-AA]
MQLPDMNLLVALDALLDEGSVVGAARRMNLSPAAMSRTLTRVREALGDPILVRAGRGLVPTPKALELRSQVRDVVEQAAMLFRSADKVDLRTLRRRFNVRANDFFIGVYGGRLIDTLNRQAPHCELRFVPLGDGDDEALREGRIDLMVSNTRPRTPEVKVQNLFATHFVGLVREGHPLLEGEITAERFAGFSHISMSRRGIARGPIDTALNGLGLERRVALIAPSFHAAMFVLPDSDLILPVPKEALLSVARLGLRLSSFTLPIPLPTLMLTQAWHPRYDKDPAHRWLRETLKASCDETWLAAQPS